jgi:hypothetical protein
MFIFLGGCEAYFLGLSVTLHPAFPVAFTKRLRTWPVSTPFHFFEQKEKERGRPVHFLLSGTDSV